MKLLFAEHGITSPEFTLFDKAKLIESLDKPIIAKKIYRSRGQGMVKIDTIEALNRFGADTETSGNGSKYYFERFVGYHKEFRVHCSTKGVLSATRKLRKSSESERWYFNSSNCLFKMDFEKPACWEAMSLDCVKALKALKLDIGGFDVRINRDGTKFTIIECNSAPSFGMDNEGITLNAYANEINKLIQLKIQSKNQPEICVE